MQDIIYTVFAFVLSFGHVISLHYVFCCFFPRPIFLLWQNALPKPLQITDMFPKPNSISFTSLRLKIPSMNLFFSFASFLYCLRTHLLCSLSMLYLLPFPPYKKTAFISDSSIHPSRVPKYSPLLPRYSLYPLLPFYFISFSLSRLFITDFHYIYQKKTI